MFLKKSVLKICCKLTGEHPCQSAILIKLRSNFIKILLRHGCAPVNLLYTSKTPFCKNIHGLLLLKCIRIDISLPKYYLSETKEKNPDFFLCKLGEKIKNRKIKLLVLKKNIKEWDFKKHDCFVDTSSNSIAIIF